MGRNEQVLSLIGLCLRGRNLEVGEEPVVDEEGEIQA